MNLYEGIGLAIVVLAVGGYTAPWLWTHKRLIAGWLLALGGAGAVLLAVIGLLLAWGPPEHGSPSLRDGPEKVLPPILYWGGGGFIALGVGVLLLGGRGDEDASSGRGYSRRTVGRLDSWS